jgi:hypothetical protein
MRLPVKRAFLCEMLERFDILAKGGALPPGSIRNWGGVEYVKVAPGDWRRRVKNDTVIGNSISETDSEKGMSDQDLKKHCFEYARNAFQGKTYKNKETGREIIISKDGLGEWKTKSKSREQIISVKILDKLLENGLFDHDAEDKQQRKNIEKISYFRSNCIINGVRFNAIITIRKIKNYGDKYYHHYLEDINIEPRSGVTRPAGKTG